jgi:hypothetical protein
MTDLARCVEELASPAAGLRASAATQLYRAGCDLAEEAFAGWRAVPEFDVLVSGKPIVGVAVPSDLFVRIRQELDMPPLANVPPEQSTAEFELHLGSVRLDILTPVDGEGPIQKFLDRFGPGIQQVEFPVNNVGEASRILFTRFGLTPVYPQPRPGADGTRMNFFLVGGPEGRKVLIELFEAKR